MKKGFAIILLVSLTASCSLFLEDEITLYLPSSIPLEVLSGESIYYTLTYFDGENIKSFHVPLHERTVRVNVKKGALSLFLIYPADEYTPLASYYEIGMKKSISFAYTTSSLIEFLVTVAEERPYIVANLSLSALFEKYTGDEIDKEEFLSLLEKGKLTLSSDVRAKQIEVSLNSLIKGRWISDRDDMDEIVVYESGESISISFYEGVYIYVHEDLEQMLTLVITSSGESLGKVSSFAAWY